MRLIDADELKKYTNSFANAYGVKCAEMFQGVINQTETACDIDEMVKELSVAMGNGSGFEQGFQYALEEVKNYGKPIVHIEVT